LLRRLPSRPPRLQLPPTVPAGRLSFPAPSLGGDHGAAALGGDGRVWPGRRARCGASCLPHPASSGQSRRRQALDPRVLAARPGAGGAGPHRLARSRYDRAPTSSGLAGACEDGVGGELRNWPMAYLAGGIPGRRWSLAGGVPGWQRCAGVGG
jgi:hypothetical protein